MDKMVSDMKLRDGLAKKVRFSLFLLLLMTAFGPLYAATITAASCSQTDVRSAVNSAVNGDTVIVPAGNCEWTGNTLRITKAIKLQGAGIGNTIIRDSITGLAILIDMVAVAGKASRITGFEFQNGNRVAQSFSGALTLQGINTNGGTIRVDHNKFVNLKTFSIVVLGAIGVQDHNVFIGTPTNIFTYIYHENWNGGTRSDGSWAAPDNLGTAQAWYMEDNTFQYPANVVYGVIDSCRGSRWVFRYNTVTNGHVTIHGTESCQRPRGGRTAEVYNNTFINTVSNSSAALFRSGTGVVYNNIATGSPISNFVSVTNYRNQFSFAPWGVADGTNPWDLNYPGGPFDSGTHTGSNGAAILTSSGQAWTRNQWVGYALKNVTQSRGSEIISNTTDTITFLGAGGFGTNMTFNTGDRFEIHRVDIALDQPGRGRTNLISGSSPIPVAWPNQIAEGVYSWNNTLNGNAVNTITSAYSTIKEGREVFSNTPKPGYTAFTYPHPLVSPTTISPPSNLRIVP